MGDFKNLKDGLFEIKFKFAIRIYFIKETEKIIILVGGGDKTSQTQDIKQAKQLIKEFFNI